MMDSDVKSGCNPDCLFVVHTGTGDEFPFPLVEHNDPSV